MENTTIHTDTPRTALQPRRIPVRGVNWLGDAVMTLILSVWDSDKGSRRELRTECVLSERRHKNL